MNTAIKRTLFATGLLLLGCLLAGCYGMMHNQISYTVSPEYFTKFKFRQFGIAPTLNERTGAAIVGWQASWWMGIAIGLFVIPAGMMIDSVSFLRAGTMHNFSYLGGLLGIFTGLVVIYRAFVGELQA